MTNFEKIKQMSVDELAHILNYGGCETCACNSGKYCSGSCESFIKEWLEREADTAADIHINEQREWGRE